MKRLALLVAAIAALFLTSCEKEEAPPSVIDEPLKIQNRDDQIRSWKCQNMPNPAGGVSTPFRDPVTGKVECAAG